MDGNVLFQLLLDFPVRGLRFQPTELELMEYLQDHIRGAYVNPEHIPVVDLNTVEPGQIPQRCQACFPGEKQEWYLFHSCPKKYPHSTREDRSTPQGYWKATGKPTKVLDRMGNVVGMRKTLVFYNGRAVTRSQNEGKTEWIMHEFRSEVPTHAPPSPTGNTWVVCSISNKPAAPIPSPGPTSPCTPTTSGGHSDRSYSPGPPSVRSGDFSTFHLQLPDGPYAGQTHSGGSSPIMQQAGFHLDLPPIAPDWAEQPQGGSASRRLNRLNGFVDRDVSKQETTSVSPTGNTSMLRDISFERWGGDNGNGAPRMQQSNGMVDTSMPPPVTFPQTWGEQLLDIDMQPFTSYPSQPQIGVYDDDFNMQMDHTEVWDARML